MARPLLAAALVAALIPSCGGGGSAPAGGPAPHDLRVGHFPNVTHAHGLVAHAGTRAGASGGPSGGKGWFEERLGPGVKLEWYVYNAGPSSMEALLTGSLDLTYVGPNPALNTHARSKGEEVRVLAGATRGGSALVVHGGGAIAKPADFRGKRVATPQLGNTQDVSCRAWLAANGFKVTLTGGDVTVLPTPNPDQLSLFATGAVDAVWTVEPWVSRLETEGKGKVLLEEKDAVTTVLVARAGFLKERPDLAKRFVAAHRELTEWLGAHAAEAKERMSAELQAETGRGMPAELLDRCWGRMRFDDAVARADFEAFTAAARRAGLMDEEPDLSRLVVEAR